MLAVPGWSAGPGPESRDPGYAVGTLRIDVRLVAAMRRALRDHDEIARLDRYFLVAEPDRSGAFQDELHLVGVGMHVLRHIAVLDRHRATGPLKRSAAPNGIKSSRHGCAVAAGDSPKVAFSSRSGCFILRQNGGTDAETVWPSGRDAIG